LAQDNKTNTPTNAVGRALGHLFGRNEHGAPASDNHAPKASALPLADIQGFVLRGSRMPMVRHFLLAVVVPAEARKLLGRLVSGDESDAPKLPLPKTGTRGSRLDPRTI
jgi:hypothetical protein